MKRESFEAGELVFQEGEPSTVAYLIVSGTVEIVRGHGQKGAKPLAVLHAGDYLGEMGVIDDHPRSASAVAKEPVVCMSIDKDEFMDMLLNRPQESINLLKVLFERLRSANQKLMQMEEAQSP
ncbi:MAG: cyclic nucleotide-binding domain-containing protein [Alphaproteobacteria bacterium]|nr:cyclic nucleotide-binding domain-containing protein [Alphaproteobacteria bacterium]